MGLCISTPEIKEDISDKNLGTRKINVRISPIKLNNLTHRSSNRSSNLSDMRSSGQNPTKSLEQRIPKKSLHVHRSEHSTERILTLHGITCPPNLHIPLHLDQFTFIKAVGHGYRSAVFLATHRPSTQNVVLKICLKRRMAHEEEKRLRREIQIHRNIIHMHIIPFYACFEDKNAFYIVLEYAKEGDLIDVIKHRFNGKIPLHIYTQWILLPLLHTVQYLHSNGIYHRDIKPENILMNADGDIMLCDFGLSINVYNERAKSTVGTLEYMSPEMIRHDVSLFSHKIDIWAIGVLTYECLVGKSPFYHEDEREMTEAILKGSYEIPTDLPIPVIDFIQRCLCIDPRRRFDTSQLLKHSIFEDRIKNKSDNIRRSFSYS